jgi:hypothetical protein
MSRALKSYIVAYIFEFYFSSIFSRVVGGKSEALLGLDMNINNILMHLSEINRCMLM